MVDDHKKLRMSEVKVATAELSGVDETGTFTDERDGQTYRKVKMPDDSKLTGNALAEMYYFSR